MRVGHAQVTCARLVSSYGLRVARLSNGHSSTLNPTHTCGKSPRLSHIFDHHPFPPFFVYNHLTHRFAFALVLSQRIGSVRALSHLVSSTHYCVTTRPLTYPQGCFPFFMSISRRSLACSSGDHCSAIATTSRMESNYLIHLTALLTSTSSMMAKVRPRHPTNVNP